MVELWQHLILVNSVNLVRSTPWRVVWTLEMESQYGSVCWIVGGSSLLESKHIILVF
jgi:hypothetical protein